MTIVDNFGPLNATSASRTLQPAALGTVLLGGRRDFVQEEGCVCMVVGVGWGVGGCFVRL